MSPRRHPRGTSLIEALIALAALSVGVLCAARLQGDLRHGASLGEQQAQALRLAERELEGERAGMSTAPSSVSTVEATPYRVTRRTAVHDIAGALAWVKVAVDWTDRYGARRQVSLASASSRASAELSGALVVRSDADARVHGRAPTVPLSARDRGDAQSVFEPAAGMPLSFVVDNASGRITRRCTGDMTADCTAIDALLLSGWIRVSLSIPPDPVHPDDTPLPLAIALRLTQGSLVAPGCLTERRDGALAYHCVIAPQAGAWSGRSEVLTSGPYRVCRYVPDHPDHYEHVDRALMQQNFLVIRGDQPCPSMPASPAPPDGIATAQHQP